MGSDLRLHDYQRRAVAHLHGTGEPGAGLFLDMGLGKTATVLSALTPEHLPALVLAPRRVAETVWQVEHALWRPDLTFAQATGTPAQRYRARSTPADITVMTRDTATDLASRYPYKTIVLDELSGYKTKSTQRWKQMNTLTRNAPHVWGLTGTPSPNGYMDLWAQIFLLDRGKRLGPTLTSYRDKYFRPGRRLPNTHIVTEWIPLPGAEDEINDLLADLCLSMSADDYLTLPPLTFNEVLVPLPARAKDAYKRIKDTLVADLRLLGGSLHTASNAAALSGRLRQIVAGFLYDDNDTTQWSTLHDERLKVLQEIIDGTGSPILVFYQFRAEKEAVLRTFPEARSIDEPGVLTDWNAGKVPLLVAHPASAGHGLNLQAGGHTVVWLSLPWSLEEWQQSNKRLHRQNQTNPVVVHVLLSPGTMDRNIYAALSKKEAVQDALLDYLRDVLA